MGFEPLINVLKSLISNHSHSEGWVNYFFEPDLVYYCVYLRTREFRFSRVFPHVEMHEKSCIPARFSPRKFTNPLVNWHAEIHFPAWISACGNTPKNEYFRTLGNPQFLVYFHMRKCTISCEFPHGESRIFAGADLHILLCISTCGNSLKTVQIRVFTLNCVSPHAVIHQNLCKSAQRIYTFSGAFPQVEIHNYKCISTHAENQILVNFLVLGNSHFLVYFRMRFFSLSNLGRCSIRLYSIFWVTSISFMLPYLLYWSTTWGNTLFLMREFTVPCVNPQAEIHFSTWRKSHNSVNLHMWKYTAPCVYPQAEIHFSTWRNSH